MYKKALIGLCAILIIGTAVQADVFYRATTSNNWHDANNWYTNTTFTANIGGLPTASDTTYTWPMSQDWVSVKSYDYRDPCKTSNDYWIALTSQSYDSWSKQVINVTQNATSGECKMGGQTDDGGRYPTDRTSRLQWIEVNVSNGATWSCDEYIGGRKNYSAFHLNIAEGSTAEVRDDAEEDGIYRQVNNIDGTMIVQDEIKMNSSSGWAYPLYLGDNYYDFGTYDNAGVKTHVNADGDYPLEFATREFNVNDTVSLSLTTR
jgi:hypothetical protein